MAVNLKALLPKLSRWWFRQEAAPEREGVYATSWKSTCPSEQKSLEPSPYSSTLEYYESQTSPNSDLSRHDATSPSPISADQSRLGWPPLTQTQSHDSTEGDEAWWPNIDERPAPMLFNVTENSRDHHLLPPFALRSKSYDTAATFMSSRTGDISSPPAHDDNNKDKNSNARGFRVSGEAEQIQDAEGSVGLQYKAMFEKQRVLQDQQKQAAKHRTAFLDRLALLLSSLSGLTVEPRLKGSGLSDMPAGINSSPLAELNDHVNAIRVQAANLQLLEIDLVQIADEFNQAAGAVPALRKSLPSVEDIFAEPSSLVSSATSIRSDDEHPIIQEYFDLVGNIHIIRERLNELEIMHRYDVDRRAMYKEGEQIPDSEDFEAAILSERVFLDRYFTARSEMVNNLLTTCKQAEDHLQFCNQNFPNFSHSYALEEAIKYNLDGPIGQMYAVRHEGIHFGVRPLDLLRVPFLHTEDQTERWIKETAKALADVSFEAKQKFIDTTGPEHLFEFHEPPWKHHGSPTFGALDISLPEPSTLEISGPRPQWLIWAGEYSRPKKKTRPASDPGLIKSPDDHFASWLDDEVQSSKLSARR